MKLNDSFVIYGQVGIQMYAIPALKPTPLFIILLWPLECLLWGTIRDGHVEIGMALFFSVILVYLHVQAQRGRLDIPGNHS